MKKAWFWVFDFFVDDNNEDWGFLGHLKILNKKLVEKVNYTVHSLETSTSLFLNKK